MWIWLVMVPVGLLTVMLGLAALEGSVLSPHPQVRVDPEEAAQAVAPAGAATSG